MRWLASLVVVVVLTGCAGGAPPVDPAAAALERVTASLRPPVTVANVAPPRYALSDRLAHYRVPGISIAVADSGRIVWARGFGVKEARTGDSVTATTLFQAASISKPVAATAALKLVEAGTLNLDENVNSYLTGWKVPDNRFTAQHKVTLRRLLSHSAGLTVHGFPGYPAGDSLPTVFEILDGKKPANTGPVRVDTSPGAIWRYAGGGTTVMQLVVMSVTKEPFATAAKRLVLDPIGMTNSSYEQPLPDALRPQAAAAHKQSGEPIAGRFHIYPEQAAAGLWTTPTDLLKWAISIAGSRDREGRGILSRSMAQQMLTAQKGPFGLGPSLGGKGKGFHFGHGGSNEGFKCELIYFPATGQGAAVMTNGDLGSSLIEEVLYAIAAEYGWPDYHPREITPLAMDSTALEPYLGRYAVTGQPFEIEIEMTREGAKLFAEATGQLPKSEVVFTAPNQVISLESGNELTFVPGKNGSIDRVEIGGLKFTRKGR
jgi:CubicO group peptidase (beta-lactamase class C family)